jgi:ABC-type nitrate/sulfonate/bicarbonate transport system permease component
MVETTFKIIVWAFVIAIVVGLIGTVVFKWSLDTSPYLQGLTNFLHVIYYVLPIAKLSPIIFIFVGMMAFRIIISLITTIWSLIPGKSG